jgi:tetratricopeptide (TPR) repeat protein
MPDGPKTFRPRGAVFLSYASQDAEAAGRIRDALSAAGIEVWFDQSELAGGDQWDAKIRARIGTCALFLPVVSASTEARREGYFRLEWRLAAQRTEMMSKRTPFLLPVTIDATRESEADVPEEFRAVHWTKLPGGETPAAFAARIHELLAGEGAHSSGSPFDGVPGTASPRRGGGRWLVPASCALVVAAALAAVLINKKKAAPSQPEAPMGDAKPVAPVSEARRLTAQAEMLGPENVNFTRESSFLADDLTKRALALDDSDAEVWAMAAIVSQDLIVDSYDESPQRWELARVQAERAVSLDPHSVLGRLAVATNFRLNGEAKSDELNESIRLLLQLKAEAPRDRLVLQELARAERDKGDDAAVREALASLEKLPGGDPRAIVTEVKSLRELGRYKEAEALDDRVLTGPPVRLAFYEKLLLLSRSWSDLDATGKFLAKIPTGLRGEDAFASSIAQYWLWMGNGDKAAEVLDRNPHDFFDEFASYEPKGYLMGWAHRVSGRAEAARAEWQNALSLVDSRMASNKSDVYLLSLKAYMQALIGQKAEARETWKLRVELAGSAEPYATEEARIQTLLGDDEAAIAVLTRRWPTLGVSDLGFHFSELRFAPEFAPIRSDARVRRIIDDRVAALDALRR